MFNLVIAIVAVALIFDYINGFHDAANSAATVVATRGRVMLAACGAIALGTLTGGWRIVRTMGIRLTRLRPRGGFYAETAAAASILLATNLHMGVSTTHVITGAIAGVGSIRRVRAVRWAVAANTAWAWIFTIPAAALVAACCFTIVRSVAGAN